MDNNISIIERIIQVIDLKGITKYKFCNDLGVSKGFLDKPREITTDRYANILDYFPDISERWLLRGEGEMMKTEVNILHDPPYRYERSDEIIKLYDIDAAANLQTIFENKEQNILGSISIPNLPICDGAIKVRGDSMYPLLKSGDIVIYKEVHHHDNIIYGEIYLIDFTLNGDYYLVVKYLKRSTIEDHVQLISYNTHHDPIDIPIADIRALAMIKASIRRYTMI